MKKRTLMILPIFLLSACAAPTRDGPSVESGINTAGIGLVQLVLSPLMVAAGLIEGISVLPYFIAAGVHALNRDMVAANAELTLDDTYNAAYRTPLRRVPDDGDTGIVYRRLSDATRAFQKVLKWYGVPDSERYLVTSIKTANGPGYEGYTLYAIIYRPRASIDVIDKYDGVTRRRFQVGERLFYEPYETDASGRRLDVVIDWAGVPRSSISTQKGQAILMTLAANSVLNGKRAPEYWGIERRWIAGQYEEIVAERAAYLRKRMGV